jgi:predicted metalloprotease with PDZ domain
MTPRRLRTSATVLSLICLLAWGSARTVAAAGGPTIRATVDARDLPRNLLHTQLSVPCQPGTLRLWYPRWIPGSHGSTSHVEDVAGLQVETPDGKSLAWRRDEIDLHCVICEVPTGVPEVRVRLDTICNVSHVADYSGEYSFGDLSLGMLNWNTCLLYPEGPTSTAIQVQLTLQLPEKWQFATALKTEKSKPGEVTFQTASLEDIIDSPVIAGENLRTFKLDSGKNPPAFLHVVSESRSALQLSPKVVDTYGRVVQEACGLFGAAHYPEYHFLVVCSNELGQFGLEHHACSVNGVRERDLIDDHYRRGWTANLLPHEYAHSWCGKFRRPVGLCTPNYHTPQKTKHLWVYEGLTEYLGEVLMVRSGLVSPAEYREMLAWTLSEQRCGDGRRWRSLEDTAVASPLLRAPSPNWNDLRRGQDYYPEGGLLWLEVDALLRERSHGQHSLDEFCKKFMGPIATRDKVVPYDLPEIVKILKELDDHDWDQFFARRVSAPLENLPVEVLVHCGYRLGYASKPSGYAEYRQSPHGELWYLVERDSLGLTFNNWDGKITSVAPGSAGDKAGLVQGMKVLAVNGRKFSRDRLSDALIDSVALRKVELLVVEGDRFRTIVLDYADGPRYLELVRRENEPDLLADILKPVAGK